VPEPSAFKFELAIEKLKRHHQVLVKSQQNWLKQGVEQFAVRIVYLLILFGIRRNRLGRGSSRSLYLPVRRVIKQIVVIIEAFSFFSYLQNFIQNPAVKVHSIWRGNYWGSSVWILTQQVSYWSYILHSSNTREK